MASNWGRGYKRRAQLKRLGTALVTRQTFPPDEIRAELIGYANEMVEQFEEQRSKLFDPDEVTVLLGGGLPPQFQSGRLVQWRATCGKELKLWRLCSEKLTKIPATEITYERLYAIWMGAITAAESIPSRRSDDVKNTTERARNIRERQRKRERTRSLY